MSQAEREPGAPDPARPEAAGATSEPLRPEQAVPLSGASLPGASLSEAPLPGAPLSAGPAAQASVRPPPAQPPRWKGRIAPWLVGLPFLALAVFWVGILTTAESMASLGWLAAMWCACLLLVPMAVFGAVWGRQAGEPGLMWWGVVAGVVCLPGFVMGLVTLPSLTFSVLH